MTGAVTAFGAEGNLTAKEALFVHHYVTNGYNAAAAARAAGFAESSANTQGAKLVAKPRVKAAIDALMAPTLKKLDVTKERIIEELARLAFFDIRKCFNPDGTLKDITELDDDTAAALAGMDVVELGEAGDKEALLKKFKVSDKKGALELLGKHLKMWTDKVEVTDDRPRVVIRDLTGKKKTAGSE
jgi:phage terminase small subunit